MSQALTILLPDVSGSVTIAADWFEQRDTMLASTAAIAAVTDAPTCDRAGEAIRRLAKAAKALEHQRKAITQPFLRAQRLIKAKADDALAPVAAETARLKALVAAYAAERQRRAEAEARAAEEARRQEIERQLAQRQAEAELFGDSPALAGEEIVVPDAAPEPVRARVDGVRIAETLAFTVTAEAEVPRQFLTVDPGLIRRYLAENRDAFTAALKQDPDWTPIPGVAVRIETKVASR